MTVHSLTELARLTTPPDLLPAQSDFPYITHLSDKNKNAVGFLRFQALQEYFDRGQVIIEHENGDPCGYLLFGSNRRSVLRAQPDCMKIIQANVQYDARRIKHATRLVAEVVRQATLRRLDRVSLWCASDLDANRFWEALGFTHVGTRTRRLSRNKTRVHCQWTLQLLHPFQRRLFGPSSLDPQEIAAHTQEALA